MTIGPLNGALTRPGLLDAGARRMVNDLYVAVKVWRTVAGVDTVVAQFNTRLAAASAAPSGRDAAGAQGNAAQRLFVCVAPLYADVVKDDEVWAGDLRLRVVAVDHYPHDQQLLLQEVQ